MWLLPLLSVEVRYLGVPRYSLGSLGHLFGPVRRSTSLSKRAFTFQPPAKRARLDNYDYSSDDDNTDADADDFFGKTPS